MYLFPIYFVNNLLVLVDAANCITFYLIYTLDKVVYAIYKLTHAV